MSKKEEKQTIVCTECGQIYNYPKNEVCPNCGWYHGDSNFPEEDLDIMPEGYMEDSEL